MPRLGDLLAQDVAAAEDGHAGHQLALGREDGGGSREPDDVAAQPRDLLGGVEAYVDVARALLLILGRPEEVGGVVVDQALAAGEGEGHPGVLGPVMEGLAQARDLLPGGVSAQSAGVHAPCHGRRARPPSRSPQGVVGEEARVVRLCSRHLGLSGRGTVEEHGGQRGQRRGRG